MKNTVLLLCSIIILGISSCTKKEVVNPQVPSRTYIRKLAPNNWQRISNSLLKYDIPLNDLTDYYVIQGGVFVSLSFDDEISYETIPTTNEGVTYEVRVFDGRVTIVVGDPLADDDITINPPTNVVVAKIILTDSDFVN